MVSECKSSPAYQPLLLVILLDVPASCSAFSISDYNTNDPNDSLNYVFVLNIS